MQTRGRTTHLVCDESEQSHRRTVKPQETEAAGEGGQRLRTISMSRKKSVGMSETEKTGKDRNYRGHRLSHKHKERSSKEREKLVE